MTTWRLQLACATLALGMVSTPACQTPVLTPVESDAAVPESEPDAEVIGPVTPPDGAFGFGNDAYECGAAGQACCGVRTMTCQAGLACDRPMGNMAPGTCVPCGGMDQRCCGGMQASCQAGLNCDVPMGSAAGTCVDTCGGMGQRCCGGGSGCTTGLGCITDGAGGMCGTCGGPGEPCCGRGAGTCTAGMRLGCGGRGMDSPGTCGACGGQGQPCCTGGGASCTAPLGCVVGATANTCATCGGSGQPCCGAGNNGNCNGGTLTCNGRGMGSPGKCGPRSDTGGARDAGRG